MAVAVTGCSIPLVTSPAPDGTFAVALDTDALTLDPANATDLSSARVVAQVYETLVEHNVQTAACEPLLAQSWAVSPDGKTWTFTLRSKVTFHDGTTLNAEAVAENFRRWMDPSSPYHHGDFEYWQILFGGFAGSGSIVRTVEAVDELRFRIMLEQPYGPLLASLSMFPFSIVSPAALKADVDALSRNPVGTGPFRFADWKADGTIALTANDAYWGAPPKLSAVVFRVIPDDQARFAALREREVHLAEGMDAATVGAAGKTPDVRVVLRPSLTVVYLSINQKVEALSDPRVRQAIAQAINRTALVDRVYGGLAEAADQFVPPNILGYDATLGEIGYDPGAAKQLLDDAGLAGGFLVQLWYPSQPRPFLPDPQTTAEAIADDLEAADILVDVHSTDWLSYQLRSIEGAFHLYLQSWTGDSPDADSFLVNLFTSDVASHATGYVNAALRDILATARAESDSTSRADLYRQAAAVLRRDMPRVPLVYLQSPVLLSSAVTGFVPGVLGVESYRNVALGRRPSWR